MTVATLITLPLSSVVFDEAIYPRKDHDPVLVQRYAEVLEEIEARQRWIAVTPDRKLLDGKHRWLAYQKRYDGEDRMITALEYPVTTPHEQLKLATELNNDHGWQLSASDKRMTAISLYGYGYTYETIAAALSVGKAQVSSWLSRTVKEQRDRRRERIQDLWLACHTQEEIAAALDCTRDVAQEEISSFVETVLENQNHKTLALHHADYPTAIYNTWKQQERSPGVSHFGNTEVTFVDNLLYLYTQPLEVVVDPFAGSGSTIDICKKRWRRYYVSDREPVIERAGQIRRWDVTEGLPKVPRWQDVRLVYLDPPYWKQAEGQYSDDRRDLANMSLEDFTDTLVEIITGCVKKLSPGAHIALLMQPTQWSAPDHQYTDHIAHLLHRLYMPPTMRYSCPYESQQCTAQMVEWAKEHKQCLVLTREIIVWRIP